MPHSRFILSTAVLSLILSLYAKSARAQEEEIPVTGTVSWELVVYDTPPQGQGNPITSQNAFRFGVRIVPQVYLGISLDSWVRNGKQSSAADTDLLSERSEARVHQAYGQYFLTGSGVAPFARLGAGVAWTETFQAAGTSIMQVKHTRATVTVGVGADLPVARHVYVTPSVDWTKVIAADARGGEVGRGLALGLGMTIR